MFLRDPLFRFWIAKTQLGKDIVLERDTMPTDNYISDLKEKYLRASTELGRAVETEAAFYLEKKFGMRLSRYLKGDIEFDLVGIKDDRPYIFKVKWKTKAAAYSDIRKFLQKVSRSEFAGQYPELFILSRSGVTEQARNFAVKNKIHVLNTSLRYEIMKHFDDIRDETIGDINETINNRWCRFRRLQSGLRVQKKQSRNPCNSPRQPEKKRL